MDLSPIIPCIPSLIEAGKSVMELIKPFIKGQEHCLPPDLEVKIKELEAKQDVDGIINILKEYEKNCNNQTINQTSYGQGAINVAGGNTTINQSLDSKNQENPDKNLFKKINEDFPDDFVHFIKKHDFGWSFENKDTDALSNLLHKYDNPKYSFINEVLKNKCNILFDSLRKFAGGLGLNTFELRNGKQRVESEEDIETIKMLNSLASDIYENIIQLAENKRLVFYNYQLF
jgi:hypothetical protein